MTLLDRPLAPSPGRTDDQVADRPRRGPSPRRSFDELIASSADAPAPAVRPTRSSPAPAAGKVATKRGRRHPARRTRFVSGIVALVATVGLTWMFWNADREIAKAGQVTSTAVASSGSASAGVVTLDDLAAGS